MVEKPIASTDRVLKAFLEDPGSETYSFALTVATALPSGALYPALRQLESDGYITSRWGTIGGGPERRQRRYYKLTDDGKRAALQATAQRHPQPIRRLSPGWYMS